MHVSQARSLADGLHPPMRGSAVEALSVVADQDRALAPLTDGQIHGPGSAWHKRDHRRFVALTEDPERAMSAVEAEVADVGLARLAHPEPVQTEEHRERSTLVAELFRSEEEPAELGAAHPVALARMHLRPPHVLSRVRPDPAVDVCEPVHREPVEVAGRGHRVEYKRRYVVATVTGPNCLARRRHHPAITVAAPPTNASWVRVMAGPRRVPHG